MYKYSPLNEEADDSDISENVPLSRPPGGNRWTAGNPSRADDFRDPDAVGLGRYLRAARLNAGLSYDELSRRARVDRAALIALEYGLYSPGQIRRTWLARLAGALGEKPDNLALLLGIPLLRHAERDERAPLYLSDAPAPDDPGPVTIRLTYYGAGWHSSRERYRAERPPRDPERQFFDK